MSRRSPQLALDFPSTWGGRRVGAGRKLTPGRKPSPAHRPRPLHSKAHPVHVTMRALPGVRSLRHASVFPAVRTAIAAAQKTTFRVIHFSVQSNHVHYIVEASDTRSLSSGV